MIYFDNAATTFYKPKSVYLAVNYALKELSANPGRSGHKLSLKAAEMVFNTREKVAKLFNANSFENVVFSQNCTMSINMCMRGLLNDGDHLIISDLEHNSVYRTAKDLEKKGIELDIFEYERNNTIRNIASLIKPNTKAIVCTHGSNVFGIKLPIKEIGQLCKDNNIYYVDVTIYPIDLLNQTHEDVLNYVNDFNSRVDAGDYNNYEKEDYEHEFASGIIDILEGAVDNMSYADPVNLKIRIIQSDSNFYISNEDFRSIDMAILSTDADKYEKEAAAAASSSDASQSDADEE